MALLCHWHYRCVCTSEAPHHAHLSQRALVFPWNDVLQALAYIQMLEMTLFKPPFVDAVFLFMLFAYEPCPSVPHSAAHQSLPPSLLVLLQSPLYQVSHELAKVPSLPFPSGFHLSQAVLCIHRTPSFAALCKPT